MIRNCCNITEIIDSKKNVKQLLLPNMNNQPEEPINSVLPTALPAWVISSMKYKSNRLLKLTRNVASPGGRVARQRGPLGSEQSPGPRQMSPHHEIHHDGMHVRPLVSRKSLAQEFSQWSRCIPRVQNDNTLWQTRRGPKRIHNA